MTKFSVLVNILDAIRLEARETKWTKKYLPDDGGSLEPLNQARARALIHLYLKVKFGLLAFADREHFVTDAGYDGGIDGYFIDRENRVVHFIQSKFRTSAHNFDSKQIELSDLLSMDINRILEGNEQDESGNPYNGKILQLMREVRNPDQIARFNYKVIILANLVGVTDSQLRRLIGQFMFEVFNHEMSYSELVFPVISGTFYNAEDLTIQLDLSNKYAGSKISYGVETRFGDCEITVVFVPTIEIAKLMLKYKNAILKNNPRSYLEFEGANVNAAIRRTIVSEGKNEFALYNNGITMLSEETSLNERIGLKNKASLQIRNPQIINGGQTAYTLGRIYEEMAISGNEALFDGKEVLLKVITLNAVAGGSTAKQLQLVNSISAATNSQTAVTEADRHSSPHFSRALIFGRSERSREPRGCVC
jgi:hypothetical protein